jgi:hypothetical protein
MFNDFLLSIFTGSCFACGISLPLCFIIVQVPKQKTHGTQFFQIDAAGLFFPTVRRALFLVHACPEPTSWLSFTFDIEGKLKLPSLGNMFISFSKGV